jgi:ADP-heptose:LPS heptosyltransferase
MKIAVFVQNRDFLGSRLTHFPLLFALRKAFPEAFLVVYSPVPSDRLYREIDLADEVRVYRYGPWNMLRDLKRLAPDLMMSLRPLSQWLNLVIGMSRAPRRVGYRTPLSRILYTDAVRRDLEVYRALGFLALLEPLGVSSDTAGVFHFLAGREVSAGKVKKPYFVFVPAGADPRKQWGIPRFLELSRRLRQATPGAGAVFVLGPREKEALGLLRNLKPDPGRHLMVEETIPHLAKVMRDAEVVVAQDCAPAHIAQMLKVPFVGLFRNRDGQAAKRVVEWFHRRVRAEVLIAEPGRGIEEIPIERVERAVERVRDKEIKTFHPRHTFL